VLRTSFFSMIRLDVTKNLMMEARKIIEVDDEDGGDD
jgi:hypothetical protein